MKDFEEQVRQYLKERNWDNLRPVDIAKSIMIEGAELLENFQWDNLSKEEVKANPEKMANIKKEIADIIIYCFNMSVTLEIDTEEAVTEKLEKVRKKYPAEMFQHKSDDPGTEDLYWKIKNQYRREGKN